MRRVVAFGSRATWTAKEYSDLDLAILGEEPLPLDAVAAMAEGFRESDLPFKVDVVVWANINDHLRDIILLSAVDVQTPEAGPASTFAPSSFADRLHVSARHRRVLEGLLREHLPGVEAWAYGSRVSGRCHQGSDLDLVLRGPRLEKIPAEQLAGFADALRDSTIPFLVEARDWARLPQGFQREIEREHMLFAGPPAWSGNWQKARLGDIIRLRRGHDLPKRLRVPGSFPIVSSAGITDCHAESKVRGPGVVIGRYGTLGKVHFVPGDYWPLNTTLYVENFKGNDPRYVSYVLETVDVHPFSDKAAVPGLNRNHLHQAEVPFTSDPGEQQAIAHILGTLDDKIELNQRMNETLEATARALFKSWFVNFEPVRAKIAGRDVGLPQSLATLFPDQLDHGHNGDVPRGWSICELADIASARRQTVAPTDCGDKTPYIGLEHMPRRSVALGVWGSAQDVTSAKSRFEKGDVLFGKLRPYFHKVGIAPIGGVCSTDIVVIAPKSPEWSAFVTATVSSDQFVSYTDQTSTGTKMPRTSWKTMRQYPLCIPPNRLAFAYEEAVRPALGRIVANIHATRVLASLRDALLPRLVFGQIRVQQAEKALAAIR